MYLFVLQVINMNSLLLDVINLTYSQQIIYYDYDSIIIIFILLLLNDQFYLFWIRFHSRGGYR